MWKLLKSALSLKWEDIKKCDKPLQFFYGNNQKVLFLWISWAR
jgi:hypothetical protein